MIKDYHLITLLAIVLILAVTVTPYIPAIDKGVLVFGIWVIGAIFIFKTAKDD